MADISSYPQATPKGSDRVLGVQAYVEGDDSTAGNPTKTFTINDINNLVPRSDGDSLYIDTEITSAQLLDLQNTPITIIPSQGAGTVIVIDSMIAKYTFGTTAYSQNGSDSMNLYVSYGVTGFPGAVDPIKILNTTQDYYSLQSDTTGVSNLASDLENIATSLMSPQAITLGDGTMKVRTYYSVIPSTF